MILKFNPQAIEVKDQGREDLAREVGLPMSAAKSFFTAASLTNFQACYNSFVAAFPKQAGQISRHRPDGVGPGEMVAWFVFDNITLGGKNSGIDLFVDGAPFAEMKGGKSSKYSNSIDNFKITTDSDVAVTRLIKDLSEFNALHTQITGSPLIGWKQSLGVTTLREWETINLTKMAKDFSGVSRVPFQAQLDPANMTITVNGQVLTSLSDKKAISKIRDFMLTDQQVPVDPKLATLKRIISTWRNQVYANYLINKPLALVNTSTMEMVFFGEITEEMVGLYCIHRNQPWARIYLP